jgi:hypothetical protein
MVGTSGGGYNQTRGNAIVNFLLAPETMRPCGCGHFDHVHVDVTLDGAAGVTSWWGYAPQRAPKINSLWFQDAEASVWEWRSVRHQLDRRRGRRPGRQGQLRRPVPA